MRVALLSPYSLDRATGNSVTAARISGGLEAAGHITKVFSPENISSDELSAAVAAFSPDLIHAFHAFKCGALAKGLSETLCLPFIITMTGTDIYRTTDLAFAEAELLKSAEAITVFTETGKQELTRMVAANNIYVIPQGVDITPFKSKVRGEDFIFLLPAGIRPVKNVLFPLQLVAAISRKYSRVRLHLIGEVMDYNYATSVLAEYEAEPIASYLGAVSYEKMPEIYAAASVVLNCSLSEGGMANSLIEAMSLGIPVLAADIEGNRTLVADGYTGLLYQDKESFLVKAEQLIVDSDLRSSLSMNGKSFVGENCSPKVESARYAELYRRVTGNGK